MKTLQVLITGQIIIYSVIFPVISVGLNEDFTWTRITYDWPRGPRASKGPYRDMIIPKEEEDTISFPGGTNANEKTTRRPPSNIEYIYQNNIPMGANAWNNKLFVTVPRRRAGVPSTLNYVWTNGTGRHNVPLIPYPDWDTNTVGHSSQHNFVSVYRVAIDKCDRLWFIDTGRIEIPGNPQQIQPVAVVVMDLKTDSVIRHHVLTSTVLTQVSIPASLTIDIPNQNCENAFAYIPDLAGYGLIVYSFKEDKAWRVKHNYFFLEPEAGEFRIGGHHFQWGDGIFSIALSEEKADGFKDAYFHSMAGFNLYKVSTRILRDETTATRTYHADDFQIVGHKGKLSQASTSDLHPSTKTLFLGLVNQNALACWNTETPISQISIVQKNEKTMIYPCDVKVSGDDIILLTNNMPVFLYGKLNYDETNFRVWRQKVVKAIEGTKCAQQNGGNKQGGY